MAVALWLAADRALRASARQACAEPCDELARRNEMERRYDAAIPPEPLTHAEELARLERGLAGLRKWGGHPNDIARVERLIAEMRGAVPLGRLIVRDVPTPFPRAATLLAQHKEPA